MASYLSSGLLQEALKTFAYVWLLLLLATSPLYALPADAIGRIQTLRGTGNIHRGNLALPATSGTSSIAGI